MTDAPAPSSTRRVVLLGYPLSHSLSPTFQNAAFRELALPWTYELHPTPDFDAAALRRLLLADDLAGCNVTVPYKERAAAELVDEKTPVAAATGAVNTVFRREGRLVGDNTDVGGFLCHLRSLLGGELPERALLLGAGGAARAVLAALCDAGVSVAVVNRSPERAARLVAELGRGYLSDDLAGDAARAGLVVDSTSLGLAAARAPDPRRAQDDALATLEALLPSRALPADALLYDLKYTPRTPLGVLAAERDLRFADGLGMLVMQGALAFERWTGREAPVATMCRAVGLAEVPRRDYAPAG